MALGIGRRAVKGSGEEGAKKKRKKTRDPNKAKRKYTFKQGRPANPRKSGGGGEIKVESK